jgi:hypothetical protein
VGQPGYFFNLDVPPSRLDSAAARAQQARDGARDRIRRAPPRHPGFGDRLDPYLEALRRYPPLRARSLAVFEGAGALLTLSRSPLPADRLRYAALGQALRWSGP